MSGRARVECGHSHAAASARCCQVALFHLPYFTPPPAPHTLTSPPAIWTACLPLPGFAGELELGDTVVPMYVDQSRDELDANKTVGEGRGQ